MDVFVVLSALFVLAVTAPSVNIVDISSSFRKMFANCLASNDTITCLSVKGIMALNRAARMAKIEIIPGISINRDPSISARTAKEISENEIIDKLPAEASERSDRLFDLALDSVANFIDSHSLELKLPKESSQALMARAMEEGRFIKKKHMGKLALALALKALLMAAAALMKHCKKGHHHGALIKYVDGANANIQTAVQADLSSGTGYAEQYPYDRAYNSAHDLAYKQYAVYVPIHKP